MGSRHRRSRPPTVAHAARTLGTDQRLLYVLGAMGLLHLRQIGEDGPIVVDRDDWRDLCQGLGQWQHDPQAVICAAIEEGKQIAIDEGRP